jgi:proteic killer suppression protein
VIRSFRDKGTEATFKGELVPEFQNIATVARRKLRSLHQARSLRDLSLPGNRLEALKHDRMGQTQRPGQRPIPAVFRVGQRRCL